MISHRLANDGVANVRRTLTMTRRFTILARAITAPVLALTIVATILTGAVVHARAASTLGLRRSEWTNHAIGKVDHAVFGLALDAASCAVDDGVVSNPSTLTVIDYSKTSTMKRLWVYDLRNRALLYEELVAHGQGSGDNMATRFSNAPETHRSSLGLFATEGTYTGKNGYSLRLEGLEPGVNDRAYERDIVMHGAPYVSEDFALTHGRLGASWGCPAVRPRIARELIDRIKGGNLLFAYYPDQQWLKTSKFLGRCGAPQ